MTPTPPDPMIGSKIKLRNGHLWIESGLAKQTIGEANQVYAVFYPNLNAVLLAPNTNEAFRVAHQVIMLFVKTKNSHGDKSISIQEFMADNEQIDNTDRDLNYLSAPGVPILHITL